MQSNAEIGEEIRTNHLKPNTRKQYNAKYNVFFRWISGQQQFQHLITNHEEKEVDLENVDGSIYTEFFGYICRKRKRNGETIEPTVYESYENVSGYRSALAYIHKLRGLDWNKSGHRAVGEFLGGYERKRADLKRTGEIPLVEGKMPLNFQSYGMLAHRTMHCTKEFELGIFGHLFLVLCWNLIARCNSVATLLFRHISWENDAMIVVFPSHKGDQEGRSALPKHVFANPENPDMCPLLALAIFVFTIGHRREGSRPALFTTNDDEGAVESRFTKYLRSIIGDNEQALLDFGLEIKDLGTHSFRKGTATYLSGMPGGPTAIAIYLRAGWSLGNVQQRYILSGDGGDQVCGRAASGLKITDPAFASLPPHFNLREGPVLSVDEWDAILPGYSTFYPNNFKPVLNYLLASLVYHQDYLAAHLTPGHPLFHQRIWRSGKLSELRGRVLAGTFVNPVSGLEATGVPPHLVIAARLVQVDAKLAAIEETLLERITQLPGEVKKAILDNFRVEGVIPMTHSEIEVVVSNIVERSHQRLLTAVSDMIGSRSGGSQSAIAGQETATTGQSSLSRALAGYATFEWGGKAHPVPEGYQFPR